MKSPKKAETLSEVVEDVAGRIQETLGCVFCGRFCRGKYCSASCQKADAEGW